MGLAAGAAAAETAPGDRLERLREEVAQLERERARLAERAEGVLGRLERLEAEARLLDARRERLRVEAELAAEEVAALTAEEAAVAERLAGERERLAEAARLLWRLGPLARVRPLVEAARAERVAAGARLVHELTARQHDLVERIQADRETLAATRSEREETEARLAGLRDEVETARADLSRAMQERQRLLARVRAEEELRAGAIEELERAMGALEQAIAGMAPAFEHEMDVHAFRGLLPMPVEGRVTRPFGDRRDPRFGTRLPHPGWDIDAPFGERVRAPFDGQVVYADWFRGYGLMVVLDHGGGVHSVYAHLSAILAPVGTAVEKGDIIGRVGDTGSLQGPYLYLEIRAGGKAEDPAEWIDWKS